MPTATEIRDSLPTSALFQAMNNAQKKEAAEQGLKAILEAIREEKIALGDWEKISIENAMAMINHGLYSAAINEVDCAIWPAHDRSPKLNISPRVASRTLEEFDRELERLMREVAPRPDHTPRAAGMTVIEQLVARGGKKDGEGWRSKRALGIYRGSPWPRMVAVTGSTSRPAGGN